MRIILVFFSICINTKISLFFTILPYLTFIFLTSFLFFHFKFKIFNKLLIYLSAVVETSLVKSFNISCFLDK